MLGIASQGEAVMHSVIVSLAVTILLLCPTGIVAWLSKRSV